MRDQELTERALEALTVSMEMGKQQRSISELVVMYSRADRYGIDTKLAREQLSALYTANIDIIDALTSKQYQLIKESESMEQML